MYIEDLSMTNKSVHGSETSRNHITLKALKLIFLILILMLNILRPYCKF